MLWIDKVFTCTVGQKPSKAEFYLDDYTDVIALLKSLKVVSTKVRHDCEQVLLAAGELIFPYSIVLCAVEPELLALGHAVVHERLGPTAHLELGARRRLHAQRELGLVVPPHVESLRAPERTVRPVDARQSRGSIRTLTLPCVLYTTDNL